MDKVVCLRRLVLLGSLDSLGRLLREDLRDRSGDLLERLAGGLGSMEGSSSEVSDSLTGVSFV